MAPIPRLSDLPNPQSFYDTYVKPRKPVVIAGGCRVAFPKMMAWTPAALKEAVGPEPIEANEIRPLPPSTSGAARKDAPPPAPLSFSPRDSAVVTIAFDGFVDGLLMRGEGDGTASGSKSAEGAPPRRYLTTQPLGTDDEGRPALHAAPVTQMVAAGEVELRPALLGNLVPMNYSLWMGRSSGKAGSGSSSGLHHDFHDNLYCLLRGAKSFLLAPPESVRLLRMSGTLSVLHENGRIVYEEQIKEGGGRKIRPDGATEDVERLVELEIKKEEIEAKLQDAEGAEAEKLEEELEQLQEEILEFEMAGEDCCEDGGSENDEEDSDNFNASDLGDGTRMRKRSRVDGPADDVAMPALPVNFCLDDGKSIKFETVELEEGDLLYLPAGWFHEVTSFGRADGVHIAFNYWMHPPDVGDGVGFGHPYKSAFWPRDWDARCLS